MGCLPVTLWRSFYIDKATGDPSSSKFWQNAGLGLLSLAMMIAAYGGTFNEWIILAYGFVVCGNRAAQMVIERVLGKDVAPDAG